MSYTPTPYRQDPREGLFIFAVGNAKPIAKVTSKSTAAFIVRACNAHEALVAVATKISEFYAGTDAPIGTLASEALKYASAEPTDSKRWPT